MGRWIWCVGLALLACLAVATHGQAQTGPIAIVAAENFYGDVAAELGGPHVKVTSILSNPDQDPHLFEASPSTARALSAARIVVYNGADYDPWMDKLLSAAKRAGRKSIVVADLVHKKSGDNPHFWYLPETMPAVAKALAAELTALDPAHEADYAARLASFEASLRPLREKVSAMRKAYQGAAVTATEPVFGYMAEALGLAMRNERFQLAVMNDTEPSAADVAAFESDLKGHRVKALLYNTQASGALTERLKRIAHDAGVPVVGVSETAPPGKTYRGWMLDQLDALAKALSNTAS
jgi:zinc/manganese transport system substrate-binding protein